MSNVTLRCLFAALLSESCSAPTRPLGDPVALRLTTDAHTISVSGLVTVPGIDEGMFAEEVDACSALVRERALASLEHELVKIRHYTRISPTRGWPATFRRKTRHEAWLENNWYEVHYLTIVPDLEVRAKSAGKADVFEMEMKLAGVFQVLAGPQPFEKEMLDRTGHVDVDAYFNGHTRALVNDAIEPAMREAHRECVSVLQP